MAEDWMPGAERVANSHPGGTPAGGSPRVTWHFTADRLDPRPSFDDVCRYLARMNYEPTLMWDPEAGRFAQFLPASRSAYAVRNLQGGVETNRWGDPHVQVEVYFSRGYKGRAVFTDGPLVGLDRLLAWVDSLGVPRVAAGDFAFPLRDRGAWLNKAGHFGHSMVPENDHSDPQEIDAGLLLGAAPAPGPAPAPGDEEADVRLTIARDADGGVWTFHRGPQNDCVASFGGHVWSLGGRFASDIEAEAHDGGMILAGVGSDGLKPYAQIIYPGDKPPNKPDTGWFPLG